VSIGTALATPAAWSKNVRVVIIPKLLLNMINAGSRLCALESNHMRLVVTIVAALIILGLAAFGLVLVQKGAAPTATAASTVRIASETQEVSALPARVPVSHIAQATGSEASPLILQANVDVQSGSPMTTGWGHKLQELELDLNLQLDLKKNQDVEVAGKDINECLVVLRAAAGRLVPDAETRVTLRQQEVAVRDLAVRAEVHPDPEIRKTAAYFQQKTTELHALNRTVEEIRTRLITQIDRLEELKIHLQFNHAAAQIGEAVKGGEVSLDDIQAITAGAQRIAADLNGFGRASAVVTEPAETAKPVEVKKRIPGNPKERPRSRIR
jgi:hypothetical protein